MAGFHPYELTLILVEAVASAVLLFRFFATGLYRTYTFFVIYLAIFCAQTMVPFLISRRTQTYGIVYMATEFAIVCLYALIVLELYSLVLRDLKGIASLARRYIWMAIAFAVVISFLLSKLERTPEHILASFFTFERSIVTGLLVFVLLITAFLVRYPVPLKRNIIFYTIGYAIYFSARTSTLFLITTGHNWIYLFSLVVLGVSDACLIFWIFALTRGGEKKTRVLLEKTRPEDEQRLLRQLDAINATLLRARDNSHRAGRQ